MFPLQLLLVLSESWEATDALLYYYDRSNVKDSWKLERDSISVSLGRKGMGWGCGIHSDPDPMHVPIKKEGDERSPAGIFSLGPIFGYAKQAPVPLKMPYLAATDDLIWVDDPASKHYNLPLNLATEVLKDWKSAEKMRREDLLYKWGIFIRHNADNIIPGRGSCIFMHLREDKFQKTAGCTAMDEEEMQFLLNWIDATKKPWLVQLPRELYNKFRKKWLLPSNFSRDQSK